MKRWIGLAAAFYPRSWRAEYGAEFDALLDDVKPRGRVFANVLFGAIKMQITAGNNWWKLAAATAVAGAAVAGGASFIVPRDYVSSAVIQITPQTDPLRPASPEALQLRAADRFTQVEGEILSRSSLAELILRPSLDLYRGQRSRAPMEDVVELMRSNIRIQARPPAEGSLAPMVFSISFAYPNRYKAQAVVRELVAKIDEQSVTVSRNRQTLYRQFWQDQVAAHLAKPAPPPPPVGETVWVLDSASLPTEAVSPSRIAFLAWGLVAGLLLGLLAAFAMRRPRGMRQLAGFAAAGCVVAGAVSLLIPDVYMSTAVMRITPAQITEDPLAPAPAAPQAAEILRRMEPQILSRERLTKLILDPRLNLYPDERANRPIEDVIGMLTRDIRITALTPPSGASGRSSSFRISFSYSDKLKAQAVVRELIMAFVEDNVIQARANAQQMSVTLRDINAHKAGENLEVLDPASLPQLPVMPNRLIIVAIGLGIGLLLGVLTIAIRRPRSPGLRVA